MSQQAARQLDSSPTSGLAPRRRRVLVTWGSKFGGTEGIALELTRVLEQNGFEVTGKPAARVGDLRSFDAVIVGGALFANRWHADARRFVARNAAALRQVPVWFFSSGPLDDSASRKTIDPTNEVTALMQRVGARGHRTFGGRLHADVKGFPAAAMAKKMSGDWRDEERIRSWAKDLAEQLPTAQPGVASDPPGRSLPRLFIHGLVAWGVCAAVVFGLQLFGLDRGAAIGQAIAAPLVFAWATASYARALGAREPLVVATTFTALFATLNALLGVASRGPLELGSILGTWLPAALVFLGSWITAGLFATLPWPTDDDKPRDDT